MKKDRQRTHSFTCSFCGASVSSKALACSVCGSDEKTGWSEDKYLDGIDLPGDFSYDDALEEEFGNTAKPGKKINAFWKNGGWIIVVGGIILLVFVLQAIRGIL
jgi:hypothetical protein